MSDDVDFMILTRSLERDLGRRVAVVRALKRSLLLVIPAAGLVVLATLLVLTNTTTLVITLAVVGLVIFELCRRGLAADGPASKSGGRLGQPL
jgi:lipopolysaccharide/colanic/teichoic acid biosynthesis glycosyltransferase